MCVDVGGVCWCCVVHVRGGGGRAAALVVKCRGKPTAVRAPHIANLVTSPPPPNPPFPFTTHCTAPLSVCSTRIQARNNARVLVAGSLELFSNAFFDAAVTVAGSGKT